MHKAAMSIVGVSHLDPLNVVAVDLELRHGRWNRIAGMQLLREHGRPYGFIGATCEEFANSCDDIGSADEFSFWELLLDDGCAHEVVWMCVRGVDVEEFFVGNGGFDPGCEIFALRDGGGCVDEESGGWSVDECAAYG